MKVSAIPERRDLALPAESLVKKGSYIPCGMKHSDDFDPAGYQLVEDQVLFKAFHRPSAEVFERWMVELLKVADLRHLDEQLKSLLHRRQEPIGSVGTILGEVGKQRVDIPVCLGADREAASHVPVFF